MDKTILDEVREAANKGVLTYVSFFNNGHIEEDQEYMAKSIKESRNPYESRELLRTIVRGTNLYSDSYDFDSIDMHLILGLVFNKKDLDENKTNAEPIKGIVRYYTGEFDALKDGEKQNPEGRYYPSVQGVVNYNKLMKAIEKSGLDYTGPETFQEFEEQILVGEPFDIKVSANLSKEEKTTGKVKVKTK